MKEPYGIFQTHKMPCAGGLKPQTDGSSGIMSTLPCRSNHPSGSPRHCRAETYYPYVTCMNSAHRIVSIIKCLLFCHCILEWLVMQRKKMRRAFVTLLQGRHSDGSLPVLQTLPKFFITRIKSIFFNMAKKIFYYATFPSYL